jgi:hypothetical protein
MDDPRFTGGILPQPAREDSICSAGAGCAGPPRQRQAHFRRGKSLTLSVWPTLFRLLGFRRITMVNVEAIDGKRWRFEAAEPGKTK